MRYFFLMVILAVAAVVSVAGWRGGLSRRPPLEIFPDMKRQPKLRPQKPFAFFADQRSSRLPVPGTIPFDALLDDTPLASGREPASTNWVAVNPMPINAELLERGRQRYTIFCAPCHSAAGDGNGIVTKYGMLRAGNYHEPRIVRLPDGEIFNTISRGKNLMSAYAAQIPTADRWAIVAYVRALQLTRLGGVTDVPENRRAGLTP
jgi:mono/diheme cytochrome c family protein